MNREISQKSREFLVPLPNRQTQSDSTSARLVRIIQHPRHYRVINPERDHFTIGSDSKVVPAGILEAEYLMRLEFPPRPVYSRSRVETALNRIPDQIIAIPVHEFSFAVIP